LDFWQRDIPILPIKQENMVKRILNFRLLLKWISRLAEAGRTFKKVSHRVGIGEWVEHQAEEA